MSGVKVGRNVLQFLIVRIWHFFDLASMAASGIEPDISNFAQMAGLSALLPFVAGASNDWIEPLADLSANRPNFRYVPGTDISSTIIDMDSLFPDR
jgi:hypothetical protein